MRVAIGKRHRSYMEGARMVTEEMTGTSLLPAQPGGVPMWSARTELG